MRAWHLSLLVALSAVTVGLSACVTAGTAATDDHCYAFNPCDAADAPATGAHVAMATGRSAGGTQLDELDYLLQPGDTVSISVWKEKDLETEALVRPDGGLSFPLV